MSADDQPFAPDWAVQPGDMVKEAIVARGWSAREACARLNWRLGQLVRVLLGEDPISVDLAADLGRALGNSAVYWLNIQRFYDERQGVATATMTPIGGGERCAWALTDRDGYAYPHDIRATHRVSGTNVECLDGIYCRRHAREAMDRSVEAAEANDQE